MPLSNKDRPEKSIIQKISLIILGLVLFSLILEIGLCLGGGIFLALQEHRNMISIKQKGTYRIMCLGESTTAIRGGKSTYPEQLEEILNEWNLGVKFSVINKGIPGTTSSYILSQLENNLNKYKPNMVITMMGVNDRFIKYYGEVPEVKTNLFDRSRAYKLLKVIGEQVLDKLNKKGSIYSGTGIRSYIEYTDFVKNEKGLKKAVEQYPHNEKNYLDLGELYINNARYDQAIESFSRAIELNPKNSFPYAELGCCYTYLGKFTQAEKLFKKAIELNPKDAGAYFGLGEFYERQEKYTQAEEMLKKAIALNSQDDWSYILLGWCYARRKEYKRAEEAFKKALEINAKNYKTYLELGWCYRDQGKYRQAEEYFKKAIEVDPKDERAYKASVLLCEERRQYISVREYSRKLKIIRAEYYGSITEITHHNYLKLKEILDKKKVKLICVQYPMRSIEPLARIFVGQEDVIFVDNEKIFKEAVNKDGHQKYFRDMFAGDFGHCTHKGNRLLAENIAKVILRRYFRTIAE